MKRTKPFRIVQQEKHTEHKNFISKLFEKKEDCNKPKSGKKGGC